MEFVLVAVIAALLIRDEFVGRRHERELAAARSERASLLQRIQAPEVAVAEHASDIASPEGLMHVPIGDYEAWLEDQKEQGVTFDA